MRKIITLIMLILVTFGLAASQNNGQKIYRVDCDEFQAIRSLYILEDKVAPSETGPWSADELMGMLSKVSRDTAPSIYDFVAESLHSKYDVELGDEIDMSFKAVIDLSLYAHNNTKLTFQDDEIIRRPFAFGEWETWAKNHFYGYVSYDLVNGNYESTPVPTFDWNLWMLGNGKTGEIDQKTPFRAFVSVGDEGWNFMLGRDRLNWGSGESGNLTISDNMAYQNIFKFTTYGSRFKYTFLTSFFPHPLMWGNYTSNYQHDEGQTGIFFYMAHRLEARFLNDKMSFVVNEAIVYQNENGTVDLNVINPAMIFHNYSIKHNANSTASLALSYALFKKTSIYGELIIDDFTAPAEIGEDTPNALGGILGVRSVFPFRNGLITCSAEGIYTDPYLYIRAQNGESQIAGEYPLSYIGAVSVKKTDTSDYDLNFIGYKYGNDLVGCNFKVGYDDYEKLSLAANVFFMVHGSHNMLSLYTLGDMELAPAGETYTFMDVTMSGNYKITNNWDVHARFDFIKDASEKDVQLVLGTSYTF